MRIRTGISKGWQLKKLSLFLYVAELIVAGFIGLQVMDSFDRVMHLGPFMEGFDYTTLHDFLTNHGDLIDLIVFQLKIFIPVFVAINIFTTAGLMYCGRQASDRWSDFWKGASKYFPSFTINFIIYGFIMLIWSVIWLAPMIWLVPYFLESCACEIWLSRILGAMILMFLVGMMLLVNASALSKSLIIKRKMKPLNAMVGGIKMMFRNLISSTGVFLSFLLITFVLVSIYHLVFGGLGMSVPLTILLVGLFQQILVLVRMVLRMMYLYSMMEYVEE